MPHLNLLWRADSKNTRIWRYPNLSKELKSLRLASTQSQSSLKEKIWCSGTLGIRSGTIAFEKVRSKEIPEDPALKSTPVAKSIIFTRSRAAASINSRDCLKDLRLWSPSYFLSSSEWMRSKKQWDGYISETWTKGRIDGTSSSSLPDRQSHCTLLLSDRSLSMATGKSIKKESPW